MYTISTKKINWGDRKTFFFADFQIMLSELHQIFVIENLIKTLLFNRKWIFTRTQTLYSLNTKMLYGNHWSSGKRTINFTKFAFYTETCGGEAALRSWDSHLVLQIAWFQHIYIMISVSLFRARFRIFSPPQPIFLKCFWAWDRQDLSFAGSLARGAPIFPSEKVRWTRGYTPKMMICESNWDQISNFRLFLLSTQKELCAQISRAIGLGIKVLFLQAVSDNG